MSTTGPAGVGETQAATARILDVVNDPQRQTVAEHTCDEREEMRRGDTPVWIGDDLGRLRQLDGRLTRMATWTVGGASRYPGEMEGDKVTLPVKEPMTAIPL